MSVSQVPQLSPAQMSEAIPIRLARAPTGPVVAALASPPPSPFGRRPRATGTSPCSRSCSPSRSSATSPRSPPNRRSVSGSFLALVLAMVFLGGTPAALIGVLTILVGWLRWRDRVALPARQPAHLHDLPAGRRDRLPRRSSRATGLTTADPPSTSASSALFLLALAINFTMIASYACYLERSSFAAKVRTASSRCCPRS